MAQAQWIDPDSRGVIFLQIGIMVVGVVIFGLVMRWLTPFYVGFSAVGLVLTVLALMISVVLHEVGHLIAGLSVGLDLKFVFLWALTAIRHDDGWKISWQFNTRRGAMGGVGFIFPERTMDERLNRRWITMLAAGPAANLVTVLVMLAALALMTDMAGQLFPRILRNIALVSLFLAIGNILPRRVGFFNTDGKQIVTLLNGGSSANLMLAQMMIGNQVAAGIRPRDWNPEYLAMFPTDLNDPARQLTILSYRYTYALDTDDINRAGELLDQIIELVEGMAPIARKGYYLMAASFEAEHRHDIEQALTRLEQSDAIKTKLTFKYARPSVVADIYFQQGAYQQALEEAREALKLLVEVDGLKDNGVAKLDMENLQQMIDQCQAELAAQAA